MQDSHKLGFRSPIYFKSGNFTPNSSNKSFKRKSSLIKLGLLQKSPQHLQQYNTRFPKDSVYYDSSNPMTKDESFQQSIPTNRSHDEYNNSLSNRKSIRESQYSLSGWNNEKKKYEHQIGLLKKDIERFRREIQVKDKQISTNEQNSAQFKQIEAQLVETYRVINYYEGKMREQEKIVSYLENIVDQEVGHLAKGKLQNGLEFKQVIQFFRNQSIQLKGEIQKVNHQNTKLTLKLQKLEKNYQNLERNHALTQRKAKKPITSYETANLQGFSNEKQKIATIYEARLQNSHNKIAMRRADDEVSQSGSIRSYSSRKSFRSHNGLSQTFAIQQKNQLSKMYGNFNSKINKIEKELDFFKIQNDKLLDELNQKIIQNGQLLKQNDELRYMLEIKGNAEFVGITFGKANKGKKTPELSQFVSNMPINFSPIPKRQVSSKQLPQQKIQFKNDSPKKQPPRIPQNNKRNELKNLSLTQISQKIQQNHSKSYKFKQITPETIRKLRYNLIRQDITYAKMVEIIAEKLACSQNPNQVLQVLEDMPYQLTSKESSSFLFECKHIHVYLKQKEMNNSMKNTNQPIKDLSKQQQVKILKEKVEQILKENILPFKNITIRRDASLTSQLTKTFKNRLSQLEPYLRDKKKTIAFNEAEKLFRQEWHLGEQDIDFIFLKSCEETAQYDKFDFYKTIHFFLEN